MASPVHVQDQVVIITGASRGIGEAIARAMVQSGARVVLAARKAEPLEALAREIDPSGAAALAVPTHTGQPEALRALVDRTLERFGRIDTLVNNAATNPHFGPMLTVDDGAFAKTFEVNLKGYFDLARLCAQHLQQRGSGGSIINVASVAGLGAAPMQGVYGMTKAAVISMTRTLAFELAGSQIRVNAIAPGLIRTKFSRALTDNETISQRIVERTPLGRVGDPDEVAGAAVYLASNASRFMTGQVMVIDGGLTIASI
jgi:NAD(P)-dependent dehydrogenase (short-subunit alcohol dehydrogenase family)